MKGIVHTKNYNINNFTICLDYIKSVENAVSFFKGEYKRKMSEHLVDIYWQLFQQTRSSRKRKTYIRKMFKYWMNTDIHYEVESPWPKYSTTKSERLANIKVRNILFTNSKVLNVDDFANLLHMFTTLFQTI